MTDFSAIGLDKNLMPNTSPLANPPEFVGGMDFNSHYDRNAVTAVNLRNFSFNSGTGGTIVLGGTNNGNGNFIIKNSSGSTIVTGNNQGITVTNGSITINNGSGNLIFDGAGVISTTNFAIDNVENTGTFTTTSTSPVDVSGATLNSFVLTRTTKAIVFVTAFGYNIDWLSNGWGMQVQCVDSIDGTLVNYPLTIEQQLTSVSGTGSPFTSFGYNIDYQYKSSSTIATLSAGTHTMKLQFYIGGGSGTAVLSVYQLAYALLGK